MPSHLLLSCVTSNAALQLSWKSSLACPDCHSPGACVQISPGKDADILLLDSRTLQLRYVFAKGVLMRTPEWTRGGLFERGPRIRPRKL